MHTGPVFSGLHHVTAVTGNARNNLDFYTRILGMRLVKKTVNQDDVSAYHLFYADAVGSPGTELTFFDWKAVPPARTGAGMISETALRVLGGEPTLELWSDWFDKNDIRHGAIETHGGIPSLPFLDPEGQRLRLMTEVTPTTTHFRPWAKGPLPPEAAIVALGEVTLTVPDLESTALFLTEVLGFRPSAEHQEWFEVGNGGPGARLRLLGGESPGFAGAGGVHHVAWRAADATELNAWKERLRHYRVATSGLVDRFYFQSLYFHIPGRILFEIATDGPGFTADGESLETLGERLSLPPFLEPSRERIEAGLEPLQTSGIGESPLKS